MSEIEYDEDSDIAVYIEQVKEGRQKKVRKRLSEEEDLEEGKDHH